MTFNWKTKNFTLFTMPTETSNHQILSAAVVVETQASWKDVESKFDCFDELDQRDVVILH